MHITMFLKDGKTLRFERITNLKKEFPFDNIITKNAHYYVFERRENIKI
nr:MAG TPA: hypothetical protein [Caudoviricetes sp.]